MAGHDKDARKVLFVDSDERLKTACSEALRAAGYMVETAANGVDALRMITEGDYTLVVTDIDVPSLDGIALYTRAMKAHTRLKDRFIFMAERLDGALERRAPGIVKRCVLKPFSMAGFLAAIDALTRGAPLTASRRAPAKHGADRRAEKRFVWAVDCRVTGQDAYNPKPCTTTADISVNGLRIRHMEAPFPCRGNVMIEIRSLKVKTAARVVWAAPVNELESEAGLLLSLPISYSTILAAVQASHSSTPRPSRRR